MKKMAKCHSISWYVHHNQFNSEAIYSVMDTQLSELLSSTNPWTMCTSVGVDNTSVNIGIRNSLKARIIQRNSAIYFNSWPCHVLHNAAQKAGTAFATCKFMQKSSLLISILLVWQVNKAKKWLVILQWVLWPGVQKYDQTCIYPLAFFTTSYRTKLEAVWGNKIILYLWKRATGKIC